MHHFVDDIHQLLYSSTNAHPGGTCQQINVVPPEENLHYAWDDGVGSHWRSNRPRHAERRHKHPDNEWVGRNPENHVIRTAEHFRLLEDGEQLEDHLAHAATRLLMALALREVG